jgi:hypothetical protein
MKIQVNSLCWSPIRLVNNLVKEKKSSRVYLIELFFYYKDTEHKKNRRQRKTIFNRCLLKSKINRNKEQKRVEYISYTNKFILIK